MNKFIININDDGEPEIVGNNVYVVSKNGETLGVFTKAEEAIITADSSTGTEKIDWKTGDMLCGVLKTCGQVRFNGITIDRWEVQ